MKLAPIVYYFVYAYISRLTLWKCRHHTYPRGVSEQAEKNFIDNRLHGGSVLQEQLLELNRQRSAEANHGNSNVFCVATDELGRS